MAWLLLALYVLIVLRWVWGHVEFGRVVRDRLLHPCAAGERLASRRVSVIIAAHNEAAGVRACLERILAQDYARLQVIVANDRSTDATGQIVRDIGRQHPQVSCLDVAALPAGWLGKAHALSCAAQQATGELLVFTDADVIWHPSLLHTVVARMEHDRLDFLSLWPRVVMLSFWEGFWLPACGWLLSLWFPLKTKSGVEVGPAFANGQLVAIRKDLYEQIGGFAAVRDELTEDIALARRVRAAAGRAFVGIGGDLLTTRMYENLGQIVAGWTRIFVGALGSRWKLAAAIIALAVGLWSAFVVLATVLLAAGTGTEWTWWHTAWLTAAVTHLAAVYTLLQRQFKLVVAGRPQRTLFPLASVGVAVLLGYCLLVASGVGTVRWGGVRYRVRGSRAVASRAVK